MSIKLKVKAAKLAALFRNRTWKRNTVEIWTSRASLGPTKHWFQLMLAGAWAQCLSGMTLVSLLTQAPLLRICGHSPEQRRWRGLGKRSIASWSTYSRTHWSLQCVPDDHDTTSRYFEPALKKTLLNVKQMQIVASVGVQRSRAEPFTTSCFLRELMWRHRRDGSGVEKWTSEAFELKNASPEEQENPQLQAPQSSISMEKRGPRSWQPALLWNRSLSLIQTWLRWAVSWNMSAEKRVWTVCLWLKSNKGPGSGMRCLYLWS